MYKEITELRPYFHSLREFNSDMSLDLKIPPHWIVDYQLKEYPNTKFKEQDANEKTKLVSFIAQKTETGYNEVFRCVKHVITFNLDKERKERLLEEKINELKKLFKEKDLSTLENLKFEQIYEEQIGTGNIQIGETSGEESEGDFSPQEEVN